jgi:hypothetical protein
MVVCFLGWAFRYLGLFLEFDGEYRLDTVDRMWIIMVRIHRFENRSPSA